MLTQVGRTLTLTLGVGILAPSSPYRQYKSRLVYLYHITKTQSSKCEELLQLIRWAAADFGPTGTAHLSACVPARSRKNLLSDCKHNSLAQPSSPLAPLLHRSSSQLRHFGQSYQNQPTSPPVAAKNPREANGAASAFHGPPSVKANKRITQQYSRSKALTIT